MSLSSPVPAIDPEQPTTILALATTTGAGAAYSTAMRRTGGVFSDWTWQIVVSGAPSGISTTLQFSLDGAHWSTVDTSTNTSGELRVVGNSPTTFLRANVGTLTGGTSPTVTVIVQPGG